MYDENGEFGDRAAQILIAAMRSPTGIAVNTNSRLERAAANDLDDRGLARLGVDDQAGVTLTATPAGIAAARRWLATHDDSATPEGSLTPTPWAAVSTRPKDPSPARTGAALTAREVQLAEALVRIVDYTGRILLTGLADSSPHYLWDKAHDLTEAATRVAELLDADGAYAAATPVRLRPVAAAVAAWSQSYTAGKALFPRRARTR
ncbi:hypothetical protein [Pseudofrankia asymbiotica]|uniref:Uncharacterized protein n=1 Tax=Pseudofrankia asymbiotica TaxID=1834516 RepID=A0A1V2I251_9ACTN|nr:hypothetical protein [Pseudofrankia asymbiotica]ONH23832.1 hypothetical protein BL253_31945 [Pseudofrankia asymbiotica]